MASKGARSGRPRVPSPTCTRTRSYPAASRFARASSASSGIRSIVSTSAASSASMAAWYPDPESTSRTPSLPRKASASQILATMYGWEIVCPPPIGSAASSYARSRSESGTNSSRGTRSIAARTRSSATSRLRSCSSTICRRSSLGSGGTRERTRIRGRLQVEVLQDGRRDLDDRLRLCVEADRQHRHLRVAAAQRAVTPSTCVMASGEVGELVPGRRGDDHLAGIRVVQGGPGALEAPRVSEQALVPGRGPPVRTRREAKLGAFPPDDGFGPFQEQRCLDGRLVVQALGEPASFQVATGQPVEHPSAVRCGHKETRHVGERCLQPDVVVDPGLAVVRAQDDRVTLEELLWTAGRIEQSADGRVAATEGFERGVRALQVGGEIVVGQV